VLQRFQESLVQDTLRSEEERDQYFGLSLRELVHTYKWQTLVLFKCLLLQPKVRTLDIWWTRDAVRDANGGPRCCSSDHIASESVSCNSP